jgi:hypothetical protein
MIRILARFAQKVPRYPTPINKRLFFEILLGKLESTIITVTVKVPSDQIPVQSETMERYT